MVNPYQVLHNRLAAMEDKRLITGHTNPSKATGGLHCALGAMLTNHEREEALNFNLHMATTTDARRRAGFPLLLTPWDIGADALGWQFFLDGTATVQENDNFHGSPEERYEHMLKWTAEQAEKWDNGVVEAKEKGFRLVSPEGAVL